MHPVLAYLGLGSNVGDRTANLESALAGLRRTPGITVQRVSRFRDYPLQGDGPPQPDFLNAVAEIRTSLPPHALLAIGKVLEVAAGRVLPAPRNRPRALDVDVLLYGDQVVDTRELQVPHPRLQERAFVCEPLAELGVDVAGLPRLEVPAPIESAGAAAAQCTRWLEGGCRIGLVPTMGALHAGHQSLVRLARAQCDRVLVTIFVNPLQFGRNEDFGAYPRDLRGDLDKCRAAGADAVFAPPVAQMYDPDFCSQIDVGAAAEGMEGALRPGHFRGVATVVARLFALLRPHLAFFGKKDAQQVAVIQRLVRDLGFPLRVVECPIVREADGLAMSSRNVYLGDGDRRAAPVLYRAMLATRQAFVAGERDRDALVRLCRDRIAAEPRAAVDYVELRREGDLVPLPPGPVDGGRLLVAARFADSQRPVRLLDNLSLVEEPALP